MMGNNRIKVMILCGSLNIGGTERNVVKIAKQIDKTSFEVSVLFLFGSGPLEEELKTTGVPYSFAGFGRIFDLRVYWRVCRALIIRDPCILHCFGYPTIYFGVLLGGLLGVPNIIVSIQAVDTWKRRVHVLLDRILRPFIDHYISDSEGARKFAVQQQRIDPERTLTIYDGVDLDELTVTKDPRDLRKEFGIDNHFPVVGVIARLQDEHKGQSCFLKAAPMILKECPEINFLIVGDGADRAFLERLADDLGIKEKVCFAGFRTDLANMLFLIDILVIPSLQWESITKTMVEAMAMARPIVASDVGDVSEIFRNGETGILIPPGDPTAIARSVVKLLNDGDYASRLGRGGAEEVRRRGLLVGRSVKNLERVYYELAGSSKEGSTLVKLARRAYFLTVFFGISAGYFLYQTVAGIYRRIRA